MFTSPGVSSMILAIHGGGAQDSSNKAHTATAPDHRLERRVEQSIVEEICLGRWEVSDMLVKYQSRGRVDRE